jgi:hypothetical protein
MNVAKSEMNEREKINKQEIKKENRRENNSFFIVSYLYYIG